jgi:hypothetical protein
MTFNWARLTWPALALRHAAPWARKTLGPRRPDAERGLVLEVGRGFEEPRHLFLAQHDRRLARLGDDPQRANEVGPLQRHDEKEPQRGDGGVDGRTADLRKF